MKAEFRNVGRRIVLVVTPLVLGTAACGSEDVGDASKTGTGSTSGVGAAAAGGAAGVDTSGARVNTAPSGSAVGRADSAGKSRGARP